MTSDLLDTYLETVQRAAIGWPRSLGPEYDRTAARDAFRGSLLWGAIGDALGAPYEHRPGEGIEDDLETFGEVEQVPYAGLYTDDTQLTIVVAESLLAAGGHFDGDDFARRLRIWLPHAIGIGIATSRAVHAMDGGQDLANGRGVGELRRKRGGHACGSDWARARLRFGSNGAPGRGYSLLVPHPHPSDRGS